MDAEIERLFVSVGADISGAVQGLSQLEARLGGFQGKVHETGGVWDGFMGGLAKVGLAINGAQALIGVGERLVGSFTSLALQAATYDASLGRLRKAIENTGTTMTDSMNKKLDENLAAMEAASGFNNSDLIPAYSNLVAITGSYSEATDRMALAQDFARGAGIELSTASRLLGKVTDETTTVLARYGIRVEKGATATELLRKVQQKFGGQSKAYMDSVLGQWTKLQNRIDDSKRAMSERLQPAFLKLIEVANKAMDFTGKLFAGWEKPIGGAVSALGTLMGALGEIFDVASADTPLINLAPPINEFKTKGQSQESQAQSEAIKKASQGGELSKIIGPQAAKGFMGNVANLRNAVRALWDFIVRAFQEGSKRLQPIITEIGKQLDNLKKMFEQLPKPMQDFVTNSVGGSVIAAAGWLTVGSAVASILGFLVHLPVAAYTAGAALVTSIASVALPLIIFATLIFLIVKYWAALTEMIRLGAAAIVTLFSHIGEALVNFLLTPLNFILDVINALIRAKNMLTGSNDKEIGAGLGKDTFKVDFSGGKNALKDTWADVYAAGEKRKAEGGDVGFSPEIQKMLSDAGKPIDIGSVVQNITINGNADAGTVKAFAGATADGLTQLAQTQVRRVGNRPQ